jgi:hypothetical protein
LADNFVHSFANRELTGFDKTLVLYADGYMARPVTVSKDTVTGLTANEAGRYIIPQGTYLTGGDGSLLKNPQQLAIEATVAESTASVTVGSSVLVAMKESGAYVYTIALVKATDASPVYPEDLAMKGSISFDNPTNTVVVTLAVDADDNIISTWEDVVNLINNDYETNTYVEASLIAGVDSTAKATVTSTSVGSLTQTTSLSSTGVAAISGTATDTLTTTHYLKVTAAPTAAGNVSGMIVSTSTDGTTYTAQAAFTSGTSGTVVIKGITTTFTLTTGETFVVGEIYTYIAYAGPHTTGGGAETVTGTIDGILVNSIDVTNGAKPAAMMYAGYVNMDVLPEVPSTAVEAALPRIMFSRID